MLRKILVKNNLPFLPFSLSIGEKMSENFDTSFLIKYFRIVSIMITSVKKTRKNISFLRNLISDIFKNVKNQKNFF
jgi:hypothetical protein